MSSSPSAAGVGRDASRQRGSALIEFALVLPFLLVLTFAVVDLGRAFYVKSMLTSAAREGARMAVERGTPTVSGSADNDSVKARVDLVLSKVTATPAYGLSGVTTNVTSNNAYYQVKVSGNFSWLYVGVLNHFGAAFATPETLSAVTNMRKLLD